MTGAFAFVMAILLGGASVVADIPRQSKNRRIQEVYERNKTKPPEGVTEEEQRKIVKAVEDAYYRMGVVNAAHKLYSVYADPHLSFKEQKKEMLRDHLDALGIPYNEAALDEVTRVNQLRAERELAQHPEIWR